MTTSWFKAFVIAAALMQACAAARQPEPALDITGNWTGNSNTDCGVLLSDQFRCGAINKIEFTLFQRGSDLTGVYYCATGTMTCRELDQNGVVSSSTISGAQARIRVSMPNDGSSCIFNGHFRSQSVRGGYACYQGGGLIEQGGWRAIRMY